MEDGPPSLEALRLAVRSACRPQNGWRIVQGRDAVLALPRSWVLDHLAAVAEAELDLTDYWEYRRLLELLELLDTPLVQRFAEHGLSSHDPEIAEAARDLLPLP